MTGLASVTIDSSLMYPTTSRRFLMALWEMEGLRINLVPKAVQEMYGYVQESEREYWYERLDKESERTGRAWAPEIAEAIAPSGRAERSRLGERRTRIRAESRARRLDAPGNRARRRTECEGGWHRTLDPARMLQGRNQERLSRGPRDHRPRSGGRLQNPCKRQPRIDTTQRDERLVDGNRTRECGSHTERRRRHRQGRTMEGTARAHARSSAASNAAGATAHGVARGRNTGAVHTAHADAGVEERRAELLERLVRPEAEENLRRSTHVHRQQRDARERHRGAAKDAHAQGGEKRGIRAVNESTDLLSGPPSAGTLQSTCRPKTAIRLCSPRAGMNRLTVSSPRERGPPASAGMNRTGGTREQGLDARVFPASARMDADARSARNCRGACRAQSARIRDVDVARSNDEVTRAGDAPGAQQARGTPDGRTRAARGGRRAALTAQRMSGERNPCSNSSPSRTRVPVHRSAMSGRLGG